MAYVKDTCKHYEQQISKLRQEIIECIDFHEKSTLELEKAKLEL